jgi:hypothetical protein
MEKGRSIIEKIIGEDEIQGSEEDIEAAQKYNIYGA